METMKVQTSLTPRRPRPWSIAAPTTNAGNADNMSPSASQPGSTRMAARFQLAQLTSPSLQGFGATACLFSGSESRRKEDHQKYRPARDSIREPRYDEYDTAPKSSKPIDGRIILLRTPMHQLVRHQQRLYGSKSRRILFYCLGALLGRGGARRSASDITAIERAPFFPTERTAKK